MSSGSLTVHRDTLKGRLKPNPREPWPLYEKKKYLYFQYLTLGEKCIGFTIMCAFFFRLYITFRLEIINHRLLMSLGVVSGERFVCEFSMFFFFFYTLV